MHALLWKPVYTTELKIKKIQTFFLSELQDITLQ